MPEKKAFILTRQWRDTRTGVELDFWVVTDNGPLRLKIPHQEAVFFIPQKISDEIECLLGPFIGWQCKTLPMQDFNMQSVVGFYFLSQKVMREARELLVSKGYSPLESDINPCDRFLMERFIRGSLRWRGNIKKRKHFSEVGEVKLTSSDYRPKLKVLSLDIETAMKGVELYSIGLYARDGARELRKVFMISDSVMTGDIEVFNHERDLLIRFMGWLAVYDPDIVIGWNIINFDMWFLERLCKKYNLPFRFGRNKTNVQWRVLDEERERRALVVPGRVVIDGIELLKAAFYRFENFSLNNVARELLGDEKLISGRHRGSEITHLFETNKQDLADYNIQDCKLVLDIFDKTNLLDFAVARTQITGLPLDRVGGSVASFDFRYLPLLHRHGFVAPNGHWVENSEASPGGFVMDSQPGIFDYVAVLDFKSLYPSIIRSFNIDPLAMAVGLNTELDQKQLVAGFKGAWFAKDKNILPDIIEELWSLRDQAKVENNIALSQAIKIIMNSFYGVLGSAGCRFFDTRLATSITRRGHQIIQETGTYIERRGWPVIYGDTDSVFVWLKDVSSDKQAKLVAKKIEGDLNRWWRERLLHDYNVDSTLEIEFETLYQRFLMPTIRGSDKGSKKRYAGVVLNNDKPELVFKGLENVRTDWTRLARDFQLELYRRIFFKEPYKNYIKTIVAKTLQGEFDQDLVYRKRLRRNLNDYQRNIPPHVQAARKSAAENEVLQRGDWVEYVITINGPEPIAQQRSMLDYQHYIDRQLAPVADGVLYFLKDSLHNVVDQQISLFN